jgi:anaerobic selenocysteine-containing dehydrogenase
VAGTSSYAEAEAADVIVMWGSNARNAHPIFFHHVLTAIDRGAKLYVVDPRRSESAQFADRWLGIEVGTDIALANTIAREIIHAGLAHRDFIDRAPPSVRRVRRVGRADTLDRRQRRSPASPPTRSASWPTPTPPPTRPSCAGRSASPSTTTASTTCCAVQPGAADRPRRPLRRGAVAAAGQNNVQGGGDMGALPDKLPGFQDVTDDDARAALRTSSGPHRSRRPTAGT